MFEADVFTVQHKNRVRISIVAVLSLTLGMSGFASNMDVKTIDGLSIPLTSLNSRKLVSTATQVISADIDTSSHIARKLGEPSTLTGITAATNAVRTNVNPTANPALPMLV